MGGYDTRDPKVVAESVVESIRRHWEARPPSKPVLLMIQGDPLEPRGISAITRLVADALMVDRGLIVQIAILRNDRFRRRNGVVGFVEPQVQQERRVGITLLIQPRDRFVDEYLA